MPKTFYSDIVRILRKNGFAYWKPAKGSHEKWRNDAGVVVIVPRNAHSRHTANSVLKQAGLPKAF